MTEPRPSHVAHPTTTCSQPHQEDPTAKWRRPRVDVMVVNYNGLRWIDGFMESLRRTSYPVELLRLVFVDNGSTDGSLEEARQRAVGLGPPAVFVPTGRNLGFTGGYARAFECGDAEYYFVINTDTRMAPDAIDRLIGVLTADPQVGLAEARQAPLEHPKYYDPVTGETSWCSGACVMVRAKALRSIGGGFDSTFFMYAEDVDLSWRMWLHGWKCVYVPEAVVEHFTEHLDPQRDHSIQHYYSMRNGALMRVMYGVWFEAILHYAAMFRVGTLSRNPWWHKQLTLRAALASLARLPYALRKRRSLRRLGRSQWVFFNGWLYGRHARDPALADRRDDDATDTATGVGELRLKRTVCRKPATLADIPSEPTVTVVIPTHNRADRLSRVIDRLMAQDVPLDRFEVILVDSNSRDDTPAVSARLAERHPNLRVFRCDQPGAAAARNKGLEAAAGGLIVLLDDDILVGRGFLRQVLRAGVDHPGQVLLGRILAPWEGVCDPFHRYLLQVQDVNIYDFPDAENVPPNYFYTACVAIPREVLGGLRFDEGFQVYGVEDIEFGFRLLSGDLRMVYLPDLQVLHDYHPTYRAYRKKKHKAGYSLGYFLREHPEHAERFQFGSRFRRFYQGLRVLRTLGAPVAGLLYLWERLLYHDGPINRWLYRWWYVDLRIQLYSGLRRFRRGVPPP